jgi:Glycosyl transferase family 2
MPTRGGSPWIADAIESVLGQSHGRWRLVVSENGPGSPELARTLEPYLRDERVEHQVVGEDIGAAGNHTRLIRQGDEPYVAILHDDDLWGRRFLERRVAFLDAHEACGLVFGRYETIDDDGTRLYASTCSLAEGQYEPEQAVPYYLAHSPIGMPSLLVRRSAYETVGATFAEGLAWMDLEMWFRIATRLPIGYVDVLDSSWRRHGGSTTSGVRLWGDTLVRTYAAYERALDEVPTLAVELTRLRELQGRAALQAALDALEEDQLDAARAHVAAAVRHYPPLARDRRALLLRSVLPLGRRGVRPLVALRHASWRVDLGRAHRLYAGTPTRMDVLRATARRRMRR